MSFSRTANRKTLKKKKIFYTYFFSILYKFQIHMNLLLTYIHATNKNEICPIRKRCNNTLQFGEPFIAEPEQI
jgi:hypothetical protein